MARPSRWGQVQAAAAKLFATKGFQAATMDDLTAEAGISKGGLYYHGRSKEELLYSICQYTMTEILDGVQRVIEEHADPLPCLAGIMAEHLGFFFAHPHMLKVLNAEVHSLTAEFHAEIACLERRYIDLIRGIMIRLAEQGRLTVDPVVGTFAFFGLLNHIYEWYDPERSITPDELIRQLETVYFTGIVGEVARET